MGARGCGSWFFRDRAGIFLTRLRVKKIPVLNPARSLKNQLPHPLAPKDKAFPLPHPPLQQHPPHKKRKPPPKRLSSSSHKTIQQEQFQGGLPLTSVKARNASALSASHLHFSKNSLNPFFLGFPSSEATPFIASSNRFRASF